MKNKLRFFFFFWLFVSGLGLQYAKANHVMGLDIQWKCLGNDTYQITLSAYRKCTDAVAIMSAVYPLITSDSCSNSYNVSSGNLQSWTIEDITPVCNAINKPCTPPNGNGGASSPSIPVGVEKHTFTYKIYLGGTLANCCWYRIQWQLCCRNLGLNTGFDGTNFMSNFWLNRCLSPGDNSPVFKNPPILVRCAGQDVYFNNSAIDPDRDSLSYQMVLPLSIPAAGSYNNPWSPEYPLTCYGGNIPNPNVNPPTGFNFDPVTGDMFFRPIQIQTTLLKIEVTEWRKINGVYKVIGKTYREASLMIVASCNNILPRLLGTFNYVACAGQQLCININTNDPDFGDSTFLFWNNNIPNAQWSINYTLDKKAKGTLCWTPNDSDVSTLPYYFTATAQDNHCPLLGSATRSYSITVKPTPKFTRQFFKKGCGLWGFEATPVNNTFSGAVYKWYEPKPLGTGPSSIVYSQNQNTVYQFLQGGTYVVQSSMTFGGCTNSYYDTLLIDTPIQVVCMPDTMVCSGMPVTLSCSVHHYNPPLHYQWSTGPNDTMAAVTMNPTSPGFYYVIVTDRDTCSAVDSVFIDIKTLPVVNLGPDVRLCYGDSLQLDAGNQGAIYLWKKDGAFFASTKTIYVKDSARYTIMVLDSALCEGFDTMNLYVNPKVVVGPVADRVICSGDNIWLRGSGADIYEWRNDQNTQVWTGDSIQIAPNVSSQYFIKGIKTVKGKTCYGFDTVQIDVHPLPILSVTPPAAKIASGQSVSLTASGASAYSWTPATGLNTTSGAHVIASPLVTTTYTVTGTDSNNCENTKEVTVSIAAAGVTSAISHNQVFIQPNPTEDKITIMMPEPGIMELTDINGNVVERFTLNEGSNILYLGNLPKAVYTAAFLLHDENLFQRIIVK